MPYKYTPLLPTQYFTFFDPLNPSTVTYTVKTNPTTAVSTPGDVRKYTQTVNGTSVILGKREYPPSEIALTWNQFDVTDYNGVANFTSIAPIVMVDNNNNAYLGVLSIQQGGQLSNMTSNVWSAQMSFLVLTPYDGTNNPLPQLSVPPLILTEGAAGSGTIPIGANINFWLTLQTKWGESLVGNIASFTADTDQVNLGIKWLEPTSNHFLFGRLYWNSTTNSSTATFLTEVQKGFSVSGYDTFAINGPMVSYSLVTPPTYGTAYTGYFAGGIWHPDTINSIIFQPLGPQYNIVHGGNTKSFSVSEVGYGGTFTKDTDNHAVATVSGTSPNFTITSGVAGSCTLTVADGIGNTSSVIINVT